MSDRGQGGEPGSTGKDPRRWEQRYVDGEIPWDSGEREPHLQRMLEDSRVAPCKAVEIGCGTGTNAIWLAQNGFEVLGLDLSETAVAQAAAKAAGTNARCRFMQADFLADAIPGGPYGLAFDRGCFHCFDEPDDRARFAARTAELLGVEGLWHSLVGSTDGAPRDTGPPRRSAGEIIAAAEPHFEILDLKSVLLDEESHPDVRAWLLVARKRRA